MPDAHLLQYPMGGARLTLYLGIPFFPQKMGAPFIAQFYRAMSGIARIRPPEMSRSATCKQKRKKRQGMDLSVPQNANKIAGLSPCLQQSRLHNQSQNSRKVIAKPTYFRQFMLKM